MSVKFNIKIIIIYLMALSPASLLAQGDSSGGGSSSSGNFSIGAEFYGMSPYPNRSQGLRLGYMLNGFSELEVAYVESSKKLLLVDYSHSEYSVMNKNPINELFVLGYGLGIRELVLDYDYKPENADTAIHISEKHQAITFNLSLGSEFYLFDYISFGFELITVSVPLSWIKNDNKFPDEENEYENDPKDFPYIDSGFAPNIHFMRAYLKVRF